MGEEEEDFRLQQNRQRHRYTRMAVTTTAAIATPVTVTMRVKVNGKPDRTRVILGPVVQRRRGMGRFESTIIYNQVKE